MMNKNILEYVLRKTLTEARGKITTKIEELTPFDRTTQSDLWNRIGVTAPIQRNPPFEQVGGFRIEITRMFGRNDQQGTGSKSFKYSVDDFKSDIITQLNALRGSYAKFSSVGYNWFIKTDLQYDKVDRGVSKDQQIVAKYRTVAFYVANQTALRFPKQLSTYKKFSGYIQDLQKGALLFDIDQIKTTNWVVQSNVITEPVEQSANLGPEPAKYGDVNPETVKALYKLFNIQQSEFGAIPEDGRFNCVLQAFVKQAQKESYIGTANVTGDWTSVTRDHIFKQYKKTLDPAMDIGEFPKSWPVIDLNAVRANLNQCRILHPDDVISKIETGTDAEVIAALPLKEGDSGPIVLRLQNLLYKIGMATELIVPTFDTEIASWRKFKISKSQFGKYGPKTADFVEYINTTINIPDEPRITRQTYDYLLTEKKTYNITESVNKKVVREFKVDPEADKRVQQNTDQSKDKNNKTDDKLIPKVDNMSILVKKFGAGKKVNNNGLSFTINNSSYIFYPSFKVVVDGKSGKWSSKNNSVYVNGKELVQAGLDDKSKVQRDMEKDPSGFSKLISNAIKFYQAITFELIQFNYDERAVWNTVATRLSANAEMKFADAVIRLANTNEFSEEISRYTTQYNYFISRNGQSSITIWNLRKLKAPAELKNIGSLFTGDIGDYLDWDSDAAVRICNSLPWLMYSEKYDRHYVPRSKTMSWEDLHGMIMICYDKKIFGAVKSKKIKF